MKLLQELSDLPGVSGDETEVRRYLAARLKERVDELYSDALGNLVAVKHGSASDGAAAQFKVLLTAHMDEVGLMVTDVDNSGLLRFATVGGVDERILLAKAVLVGKNRVPGVVGLKPVHLLKPEERKRIPDVESLYIDIGASKKEEAEGLVKVGDYVSFATKYTELGETARGKAFDDRVGCAALAEILDGTFPFTVYGVFATQEEVGSRGATVAAYRIDPDIAFALEGTVCDDMPKKRDVSPTSALGRGPALTIADRSVIADKTLVELLIDTARREGIPYQIKQPMIGGTDAGAIQRARGGVRSAVVAVPCRYIHSPVSIVSLTDLRHAILLMQRALGRIGQDQELIDQLKRGRTTTSHD
jgi:tetrahedral aminopeptidase